MKSIMLFLACSVAILAVSCQKNKQTPPVPPPVSNETVRVQLKLTGDILTSESNLPNGRKSGDILPGARSFGTGTLYSVSVHRDNPWFPSHTGLFSHPDSIYVNVPVSGQYKISIGIFKKGTGTGLFYTLENGLIKFDYPISSILRNRMDTVTGYPYNLDSSNYAQLQDPADTAAFLPIVQHTEVDYYHGDTTATGTSTPAPISISVKRLAFGVQLSATNFTAGKLKAEFSYEGSTQFEYPTALPFTVTPADINSQYHIFAADVLRSQDSTWRNAVRVTWEKPDGNTVILGEKTISFKRNVLTKLNVTIPNTGRTSVGVTITETNWSGNETVDL